MTDRQAMIPPGATIGIMGGGQLGRMLAEAASMLGLSVHIYTPEAGSPASQVAARTTVADYSDAAAMQKFARDVDIVTFEFENIPAASLAILESEVKVAPSAQLLALSQHRIREKDFIRSLGILTAEYAAVRNVDMLAAAVEQIGCPSVLKTCELGYDGKGQARIAQGSDLHGIWHLLATRDAVLEAFVDYTLEISVIVARNGANQIVAYEPAHNVHAHHILDTTTLPAPITPAQAEEATAIAVKIAESVGLIGLLAVEMFVTRDGRILVNELAPRPHNSGHWTQDASRTSQFEQHIRAICNWPLGDTSRHAPVTMKNLIGSDAGHWKEYAKNPKAKLHLYGKTDARPGRKMGHVNLLD